MAGPAAALQRLARLGEARVRAIVAAIVTAWVVFVLAAAGVLAAITYALGGPWWLYWVDAALAMLLLAPVVFLAFVVLGAVRALRESADDAAAVEGAVFAPRGP